MDRFNFSNELINAFNSAYSQYRNDDNVFGIDIGSKYLNGRRETKLCIRVHLADDAGYISTNQLIIFIGYTNYGEQSNRKVLPDNSERTQRFKIFQPGISIGYAETGTLGLICFDKLNDFAPCLLTAAHIIQGSIGSPVSQPGPGLDGGHLAFDAIANTTRYDSGGDAGIAILNGYKEHSLAQLGTSNIISAIGQVKIGDILIKSGRTTDITTGYVDGIGVYFQDSSFLRKEIKGFRLVPVDDQNVANIEISDNGDSGAVWFDAETNEGKGLLFAGENSSVRSNMEFCLAQHLTDIFERLEISLNNER